MNILKPKQGLASLLLVTMMLFVVTGCSPDKRDVLDILRDVEKLDLQNNEKAEKKLHQAIQAVYKTSDFESSTGFGTPKHVLEALNKARLTDKTKAGLYSELFDALINQSKLSHKQKGEELIKLFNALVVAKFSKEKKIELAKAAISSLNSDSYFKQFSYDQYTKRVYERIERQTIVNAYKSALAEDKIEIYQRLIAAYPDSAVNNYIKGRIEYLKSLEGPREIVVILEPLGGDLGNCQQWDNYVVGRKIKAEVRQFMKAASMATKFTSDQGNKKNKSYFAVSVEGSAFSATYTPRGGGLSRPSYTGATISGLITNYNGGIKAEQKFNGHLPTPEETMGVRDKKCSAPFDVALEKSDFIENLTKLLKSSYGIWSIIQAFVNGADPASLRGDMIPNDDRQVVIDLLNFLLEDEVVYAEEETCFKKSLAALKLLVKEPIVLPGSDPKNIPEKWKEYWPRQG
jgi:hypothetical protein